MGRAILSRTSGDRGGAHPLSGRVDFAAEIEVVSRLQLPVPQDVIWHLRSGRIDILETE
jgi:hypothetical protein